VNKENKQGKKERKKEKRKDQSRKTERAQASDSAIENARKMKIHAIPCGRLLVFGTC
jgi:hypothetical protein